jgi:hypothetical protein
VDMLEDGGERGGCGLGALLGRLARPRRADREDLVVTELDVTYRGGGRRAGRRGRNVLLRRSDGNG